MPEYVEREALLDHLGYETKRSAHVLPGSTFDIILREPAADVVPVIHGRWIKVADLCGIEVLKCSVCGVEHPRLATQFCCDCGAKMDLERCVYEKL